MKKNFLCVVMLLCLPVQVAHAVSIDTTGNSSSALIYPYYTINNNFESLVSIKNVNNDYKALKIRFHDSKLGLDIFDFSAFVPPSTSFNIRVLNDNKIGPSIFFNRSLCTLPTFPSGNIGLVHGVYDAIGQLDVSEGYIEVIEMGILESNVLKNELSKGNCGILAEKNNSFDYSEDLVELGGMTQGGAESSDGFYASPSPKGMLSPSGGIQGSVVLNNTVSGESYTIQATGIADYSTRAQNYFAFSSSYYKLPSLASGSGNFTNQFWSTTNSDFGLNNADSAPNPPVASGINPYPISHVLAKSELTTEYFSNSEVDVVTDWIITNPMYMHNIFREAPYNIIASTTETNGAVSPISFSPGKVQNKVLGRSVNVFSFGSNKSILGSVNETKILLGSEASSGIASLKIDYNFLGNHKGAPLIATAITRNKNLFNNTSTENGAASVKAIIANIPLLFF